MGSSPLVEREVHKLMLYRPTPQPNPARVQLHNPARHAATTKPVKPEHKLMCAIFGEPAGELDNSYLEEMNGVSLHDALMEALDNIQRSPRENRIFKLRCKPVILLRFGFESPDGRSMTLEQVGKGFDVTRERIRQIEAKTLQLLRHPSGTRLLKAYIRMGHTSTEGSMSKNDQSDQTQG